MKKRLIEFDEFTPTLNKQFAEYLEGKTVAIVGRSGISNLKQGDLIDSHDVVARVHWPIPYHAGVGVHDDSLDRTEIKWDPPPFVPEQWQSCVGEKTNIFYTSIHNGGESWCQDIIAAFKTAGGCFLCNESPFNQVQYLPFMPSMYHPQRNVGGELFAWLHYKLGSQPLEGTVVIADILRHNVESVYLTGFPCYVSEAKPKGINERNRYSYNDFRYLRSLCLEFPDRISIDLNMESVFQQY